MLDVETTVHLRRVLGHIVEAEAAFPEHQGVIKARESLSVLLALNSATEAAIALHKAEDRLEEVIRQAVGVNCTAYKQLHCAIREVEKARLTRTIEKAFGTEKGDMLDTIEKATNSLFDQEGARILATQAKAILERHHGFAKEP